MPKNTNNPFFDQALAGCKKAEKELNGAIKCLYIGPGEHGGGDEEAQIVADLITKKVDGIAVSPANAAAMANALQGAAADKIPVLTWDSDLLPQGQGPARSPMSARTTMRSASTSPSSSWQIKPKGGTICIQSGGAAAANHNERMQGIRDTLAGKKSAEAPGERLTGQNGWKEADGCPLYTNDDFARRRCSRWRTSSTNIRISTPSCRPAASRSSCPTPTRRSRRKYKDKIASGELALVVADTLPVQIDLMKKGLSAGQVGQRPFEMGYKAMYFLKDIKDGKAAADGPDLYRPRRLHAEERRHLHRRRQLTNFAADDGRRFWARSSQRPISGSPRSQARVIHDGRSRQTRKDLHVEVSTDRCGRRGRAGRGLRRRPRG